MQTTTHIHIVDDSRSHTLRARTVDADWVVRRAVDRAEETNGPRVLVKHGGSVPNCYGYPAFTEAVLAVAVPVGDEMHVFVWADQLPANKVTLGGAAAACFPGARQIFDHRFGEASRAEAKQALVDWCRARLAQSTSPAAA